MKILDEPWKKYIAMCVVIFFISLFLVYYPVIFLSVDLFLAMFLGTVLAFLSVGFVMSAVFFCLIKKIYSGLLGLNNHSYSQYGSTLSKIYIVVIISLYLIIFFTYFLVLEKDNMFTLLLGWLPVLIIRTAHYADYNTGKKIGEAVANYVFPIWIVIVSFYINKCYNEGYLTLNQISANLNVFLYFIAILSVSYILEILMVHKINKIILDIY